jgi:hypothetical protein
MVLERAIRDGRLPTWNAVPGGGEPGWQLLFNGTLTLRFVLFLLFPDAPGFGLGLVLQMVIGGLGAHLLARRWTGRSGGALAAVTFMLCGFNVSWMMWPHAATAAWIPWVVWAAARVVDRAPVRRSVAVLAALTACLLLGGFPAVAVYGLLTVTAVVLALALARKADGTPGRSVVTAVAAAAAGRGLGAAAAAVQVLPALELLRHADLAYRGPVGPAVDPRVLLLTPLAAPPHPETTGYAGLLGLTLALVGAAPWPGRQRRERCGSGMWTAVLIGSLVLALRLPRPLADLLYRLPVLDMNPNNRWLAIYGLAVAVLAGVGLSRLMAVSRARTWRRLALVAAALVIVLQATDLGHVSRAQNAVVSASSFLPETPVTRWLCDHLEPGQHVIAQGYGPAGTLGSYRISEWFAHGFRTRAERELLGRLVADAWVTPTAAVPSVARADLGAHELYDLLSIRFLVAPCGLVSATLGVPPGSKDQEDEWRVEGFTFPSLPPRWRLAFSAEAMCVLEHQGAPPGAMVLPADSAVRVAVLAVSESRAGYRVTSPAGGTLVRAARAYPGWRAWVDGKPATITSHQGFLQAVEVPPGQSVVTFRYRPLSLIFGLVVSVMAWAVIAVMAVPRRR